MPCNSEEPTYKQRDLRNTAQLLVWVFEKTGKIVPLPVRNAAEECWCNANFVPKLCEELRGMTEKTREGLVYNAHDKMSRRLADWWETHQEEDKKYGR